MPCYHTGGAAMQVEFFGVPRQRAGIARLSVQARTLGELWQTLSAQIPTFGSLVEIEPPVMVANLNGDRFVTDPLTPLAENDCVLILSADAGG